MLLFLVPENDNIMDNIIKLRERLGWKTEIPRHAMGCKDAMEKLKDLPDNDKVGLVKQIIIVLKDLECSL